MNTISRCEIDKCKNKHFGKGLCEKHYTRKRRHGNPLYISPRKYTKKDEAKEFFYNQIQRETKDCIIWKYDVSNAGYGRISIAKNKYSVHRLALTLKTREPKDKECALHSCGNRLCFNYRHLRWGSYQDNMDDKVKDGNAHRGEKHHATKISEQDVLYIRQTKEDVKSLTIKYNMSRSSIYRLKRGGRWGNLL